MSGRGRASSSRLTDVISDHHDCPGCIFYVDEFGALQPHRSNQNYLQDRKLFKQFAIARATETADGSIKMIDEAKLKAPTPVVKLCPACESIKLIYPKASSQNLRKMFLLKTSNAQSKMSSHVLKTHENNLMKANSVNLQAFFGHGNRKLDDNSTATNGGDTSYDAMLHKLNQNSGEKNSFRLREYCK